METTAQIYCWFRNPYQTQTNKRSLKDDDIDADVCVLRTASAQKLEDARKATVDSGQDQNE